MFLPKAPLFVKSHFCDQIAVFPFVCYDIVAQGQKGLILDYLIAYLLTDLLEFLQTVFALFGSFFQVLFDL